MEVQSPFRRASTRVQGARAHPPNSARVSEHEQVVNASRRTRLAGERTYLAWWRTGLTSLGVAVATGRLVPAVSGGASWPYEIVGVLFALVGLAFIGYAYVRQREV